LIQSSIYPSALAIGALCFNDNLQHVPAESIYKFLGTARYPGDTLDEFISSLAIKYFQRPLPKDRPHIIKGFPFADKKVFVYGTCFYIGNGLIVTAGHNVFEEHTATIKPEFLNMKIILGLSQKNIELNKVPEKWVFGIQRYEVTVSIDFAPS
jgi:hypothetical protein